MINIVFLDIDGVLNRLIAGKDLNDKVGFSDDLTANLKTLIETIDNCKIVISSSWRLHDVMPTVSKDRPWQEVLEEKLGIKDCILDSIPEDNEYRFGGCLPDKGRGDDIALWLDRNSHLGIGDFVILDDS